MYDVYYVHLYTYVHKGVDYSFNFQPTRLHGKYLLFLFQQHNRFHSDGVLLATLTIFIPPPPRSPPDSL